MIRNPRIHSEPVRFITDHNLSKLAKWLRLLGYDTLCHEGKTNKDLWNRALKENRIVITRKKHLPHYQTKVETVIVAAEGTETQLAELFLLLSLRPQEEVFLKFCTICNTSLRHIDKKEIMDRVPSYILESHHQFYLCPVCKKVYWQGSHVEHIKKTLKHHNLMDLP
jgi:uncharacterized protein